MRYTGYVPETTPAPAPSTPEWTVAYNERKSTYEVHAKGCKHLMAPHLDVMHGTYQFPTGQEAALDFEAGNEDCFANLGPCARGK